MTARANLLSLLVLSCLAMSCQQPASIPKVDGQVIRDLASALYNNQLYTQSIEQYNFYLDNYDLNDTEAGNILYTIGNIYFERIHDYENALAYYLRLKHLYPESTLLDDVNKKRVICLERLERSTDAQQVLEETVLLDSDQATPKRPGATIAKIGKRVITTGDLEHEISQLPPYVKAQLNDKSKKVDFLRQYIATELFYSTAKREGLDKDPSVVEGTFRAKKNLMVQRLLEKEISEGVDVQESDIELYYKAHREDYAEKDEDGKPDKYKALADVRLQVMQDVIKMKQKEAYDLKVQNMMRAEAVVIYDDKL